MSSVGLSGASKNFGSLTLFENLELSVPHGQFVTILGSSGSGKSTLLRILADLETLSSGQLEKSPSLKTSFVFQEAALLPWRTVQENIQLPLELDSSLRQQINATQKIQEVLGLVELKQFADYFPHQLSGGMKMRVSLARALVTEPDLLLLDEPFAALDEVIRFQLQEDLHKIWQARRMTVCFVTHSISEGVFLADRVLVLDPKSMRFSLDERIELGFSRNQDIKKSLKYIDYVTKITDFFRRSS